MEMRFGRMTREQVTAALKDDPELDSAHQPYTAFNQGFDAYILRLKKELNPYRRGSTNFRWWEMGYEEAQR